MKKLLIIHFSQDFTKGKSQLGGYGRIYNLCKDGNVHIVFTNSRQDRLVHEDYFIHENLRVVQLPLALTRGNIIRRIVEVGRLSKEIAKFVDREKIKPDLLFGHSQLPNYFCLSGVKRRLNIHAPLLWEFNTLWGAVQGKGLKYKIAQRIICYFEKRIVISADGLVYQTEAARNWIESYYSIVKKWSVVIPNAVHEVSNNRDLQFFDKRKKILVTGLFDSMNGLGLIVSLLRKERFKNVEFHFFGSGPWADEIQKISDNSLIYFHGSISRDEMNAIYKKMHFILIPRLNSNEADLFIPSKLIEAMSFGLIPIITKVRGMSEVVAENEGVYIDKAETNCLKSAIDVASELTSENMKVISARCSERVLKNYNWDKNYKRIHCFFSDLMGET